MRKPMNKNSLVAAAKVAGAGATIFAIGWGILVLQPEPEVTVAPADADITMFNFGPKSDQQKFVDALMEEGMEKPRAYDHNGNKLFFSTVTTPETPRQVMERMQQAFVNAGLNQHVHLSLPPGGPADPRNLDIDDPAVRAQLEKDNVPRQKWADDYFGGLVPVQVTEKAVVMAGATSKFDENDDGDSFLKQVISARKAGTLDDLSEAIKAMRYVDVVQEKPGKSRITAIWSDEDYDPRKIANYAEPGEELGVDPSIPVCPGCERLFHFKGETEKAFANHAFRAPRSSVDQMIGFYKQTMPTRGWQQTEANAVMQKLQLQGIMPPSNAKMANFTRGGDFLTVVAWDTDDSTKVHIARSN